MIIVLLKIVPTCPPKKSSLSRGLFFLFLVVVFWKLWIDPLLHSSLEVILVNTICLIPVSRRLWCVGLGDAQDGICPLRRACLGQWVCALGPRAVSLNTSNKMRLFLGVWLYIAPPVPAYVFPCATVLLLNPYATFLHCSGTLFYPSRMLINLTGKEESISLWWVGRLNMHA